MNHSGNSRWVCIESKQPQRFTEGKIYNRTMGMLKDNENSFWIGNPREFTSAKLKQISFIDYYESIERR